MILGATGPTGIHLAGELRGAGVAVRVVSRSAERLAHCFGIEADERFAEDVSNKDAAIRAIDGYPIVFDCIGLPGDRMRQHPVIARSIGAAVQETGARCIQASSCWAYLPLRRRVLTEEHPRDGGNEWVQCRREAEDILLDAGAAILHLPDFYGPFVHTSVLQEPLKQAAAGKAMNWVGSTDTERDYVYVRDAMRIAARVARCRESYGDRWIIPGGGPLTGKRAAEIVGAVLGRHVKVMGAGPFLLRLVSLFKRDLAGFMSMVPDYVKPVSCDATKLQNLLGGIPITPYEQGFAETLAWLRAEAGQEARADH